MNERRLASIAAAVVIAGLVGVELDAARRLSVAWDEVLNVGDSLAYATHGEVKLCPAHPPLFRWMSGASQRALGVREGPGSAAVYARLSPEWLEQIADQSEYADRVVFHENPAFAMPGTRPGGLSVVLAARLPMILFPALAALVAFLWARERFGSSGGLVALGLVATWPDLLGHGVLVMNDVPVSALLLLAGLCLDRLIGRGGAGWLVGLGLSIGAALATKFTTILVLPVFAAAAGAAIARPLDPEPASLAHPCGSGEARRRARAIGGAVLVVALLALVVLEACYPGAPAIATWRTGFSRVWLANDPRYLGQCLGEYAHRFWYYFLIASALKLPLGTLALLALAAFAAVRGARGPLARELALTGPGLFVFAVTSAVALPVGTRYVIPAVGFLLVSAGRVATWAGASRARRAAIAACLAANVLGAVHDHPHHASATNLLAGDPRLVYLELDDSCQDWGQGFPDLARWQREHEVPRLTVITWLPVHPQDLLDASGVEGKGLVYPMEGLRPLFAPEREVYAVSAHVVSRGRLDEREWIRRARERGEPAGRLVLGGLERPDELVGGGFLIFDRRGR